MTDASERLESELCFFSAPQDALELEEILERIFLFIEDRSVASLVCRKWYDVDRRTRRKVTVSSCSVIRPSRLTERFHAIQAVKIKRKPSRYGMIRLLLPAVWGGDAKPWIFEISVNCMHLNSLYLRRMVVKDKDLNLLAKVRGPRLQVLRLAKCYGFSTIGLEAIVRHCRSLKVLSLEECSLDEHSGSWLHVLSQHNSSLELLNIAGTGLKNVQINDLALLASNGCPLASLKLNELELDKLSDVLRRTTALQELGGISLSHALQRHITLPSKLTSLVSLCYKGAGDGDEILDTIIQPIAASLRKIDLQFACLSVPGHCQLLGRCSNLEVLQILDSIGDDGLEVVASQCKKLQWLRIECGHQQGQRGLVTETGLISAVTNCNLLQHLSVYVTYITNIALRAIGNNCPYLKDLRLFVVDKSTDVSKQPLSLDNGVKALMKSCPDIHHFALCLRSEYLTDKGMEDIGIYGRNLKRVTFRLCGVTDEGIIRFANRCHNLKELSIFRCIFSERAIASAVSRMNSLTQVFVQGDKFTGRNLLPLMRDSWTVEFGNLKSDSPGASGQFVAYRCL